MSLYVKCKNMKNPSEGLLKLFKKKPNGRIWAYKSGYKENGEDFVSLDKLKKMSLRNVSLRIGSPEGAKEEKEVLSRQFGGQEFKQHLFTGRKQGDVFLCGIGHKETKTWFIDVTDKIVEALNAIGPCAISKSHCQLELISPRVRQCKFCGDKYYRKVVTQRIIKWEEKK